MKNKTMFIIVAIIVIIVVVGGYFLLSNKNSNTQNLNNSQNISKKTIESSSDLALSLSDLPAGWEISTRGERTKSNVAQSGIDMGWIEGYNIVFRKVDSKDVSISQDVSIYPIENISKLMDDSKNYVRSFTEFVNNTKKSYDVDRYGLKYRVEALSNPNIGDDSFAYKYTYEDGRVVYSIELIKDRYYEGFSGYDYELMKELASKAVKMI